MAYSSWGQKESDMTEQQRLSPSLCFINFYKDNSLFKCFFVILSNRFYLYNIPSGYLILNKCQCSFYFCGTNKHIKQFLRAFYVLSLC